MTNPRVSISPLTKSVAISSSLHAHKNRQCICFLRCTVFDPGQIDNSTWLAFETEFTNVKEDISQICVRQLAQI